jgi:uncharacterized protein YbjT (DUF2867 family)
MSGSKTKVLVVGAAGHFAGLVVPALAGRGVSVRGLVRDEKQGEQARRNGAAEVAIGDLRNRASIDAALRGVGAAFYIAPVYQKDEAQMGLPFVAAAKAAGVRRIVFSSAIHPVIGKLQNHIQKVPVEEAVVESGMEFTILNPTVFYQNLAAAWPGVVKAGTFAEPFSASARISRVDYRDVAEVAAIAFAGDRLLNGTFELCADGGLDRGEVAAVMGEVLGRPIEAIAPDFRTWVAQAKLPYDEHQTEELKAMYDYYDRHGLVGNALTLRAILGREPRSMRQFFADLVAGTKTTSG